MPDLRFDAVTILVVLLPGFFAARIEQRLVVNPRQNEFDKIVEALLYSFFTYLIFAVFVHPFPVALAINKSGDTVHYSLEANGLRLALLPLIAFVLSVLVSFASNNDLFGRLFRWLRVTRRTWRSSIWHDVFYNQMGVVQVELSDGRNVMGWLKFYSDRPEEGAVFLERAAWINSEGGLEEIQGPGILLTGIKSVMFLRYGLTESPITYP